MKVRVLVGLLISSLPLCAADAPKGDEGEMLAGSVRVLFERKCNDCHGSQLKKPDGEFGYVLDLKRIAENADYVAKGKPDKSDLFRMLRDGEMPPDDRPKTQRLTAEEKDLVRRWIALGAPHTLPAVLPNLPESPAKVPSSPPVASAKERAGKIQITLAAKDKPAGEIFADLARHSGLRIDYIRPAREPVLSIQLKNGTAFEAITYLSLCGNFLVRYSADSIQVRSNLPTKSGPAPGKGK